MRLILIPAIGVILASCGSNKAIPDSGIEEPSIECITTETSDIITVNCTNGSVISLPKYVKEEPEDVVFYYQTLLPKNTCAKIAPGIWAENIQNGRVFDVYKNENCSDAEGEFCDNVVPSDDATGAVDEYRGSGTICWAGRTMISGIKQDNGDLLLILLEF